MSTKLDLYYNKFNEEKRLNSRHGQVEYRVSMHYIHRFLKPGDRILDVGAATGRYSIPLFEEGYDVTALEPVQHNLGRLKAKKPELPAYKGDARKLKRFQDESFDLVLLFGPMYHLISREDKLQALKEAKRVTRKDGVILSAYVMNEYSILTYGFREQHILEILQNNRVDSSWRVRPDAEDLYDYVRLEDINSLNEDAGLERVCIFSPDGPANHMRRELNRLTEEEFGAFVSYQLSVAERPELLGAGGHLVDVVRKQSSRNDSREQ
ncbi:MAG: methyltransferase domain-containing protein [Lachnospiraceae bacterium]|nr:methyltransferase domain-containing protein [Lachnospiraceae bacterium]